MDHCSPQRQVYMTYQHCDIVFQGNPSENVEHFMYLGICIKQDLNASNDTWEKRK